MTLVDQQLPDPPPRQDVRVWVCSSLEDIEAVYAIRHEVFVTEQHLTRSVQDEPDDRYSIHVLASLGAEVIGTGRVTFIGDEAQIAWVAVRGPMRGLGAGRKIMERLIEESRAHGSRVISLNAQTHALPFYEQLGFRSVGRRFTMSNIEHQHMIMELC